MRKFKYAVKVISLIVLAGYDEQKLIEHKIL